jgi:spermine oxidase
MVTKWFTNPFTRGSYSFRSLTTDEYRATSRKLAQPIRDANERIRILFAGEATSDHYFSTVHGAVETGYREANRLISSMYY